MKKIMEQPIFVCKALLIFRGSCRISSIGLKGCFESFSKEGYRTVEKSFGPFFLKIPTMAHIE